MNKYLKKFFDWTELKIKIYSRRKIFYFKEREIWWTSLGVNIGHEQDGKNKRFERPVLILKVFNREVLWVLPLTSKGKTGKYYYKFEYNNQEYSVVLSQLRLISSKRLLRKIRTFEKDKFKEVRSLIKNLL